MTISTGAVLNTQGQGNKPQNVEIPFVTTRDPSPVDKNYPVGKSWINSSSSSEFCLTSFSSTAGTTLANWTSLGGAGDLNITAAGVTAAMVAGVVTTACPSCTTSSTVLFSAETLSATFSICGVVPSNGSFTITSQTNGETSTFFYAVIN